MHNRFDNKILPNVLLDNISIYSFTMHLQLVLESSRFVIWMMKLTNFFVRKVIGRTA